MRSCFLFTLILYFISTVSNASLQVLLCNEGMYVKSKEGTSKEILPGDLLESNGTISSSACPAYISLYDTSGKVWEQKITQPVKITAVEFELKNIPIKPYIKSLIAFSLAFERKKYMYSATGRTNPYKSLSHLTPMDIVRCPNPRTEMIGSEKCKVEAREYTLHLYTRETSPSGELVLRITNIFEDEVAKINVSSFTKIQKLKISFQGKIDAKDQTVLILHLDNLAVKGEPCDTKAISLITKDEITAKNKDLGNLKKEFEEKQSPTANLFLAIVCEDHQMYFDSAEIYMEIYNSLKGTSATFNNHLYKYLVGNYLYNYGD